MLGSLEEDDRRFVRLAVIILAIVLFSAIIVMVFGGQLYGARCREAGGVVRHHQGARTCMSPQGDVLQLGERP